MKSYKILKQRIISNESKELNNTINIYQKVIEYLLPKIANQFYINKDFIKLRNLEKMQYIEKLIHKTKNNEPKYKDFNKLFINFPSYFRRTAINDSIGIILSFNSRFDEYIKDKKEFESKSKNIKDNKLYHIKPPTFNLKPNQMPTYYKDNMFKIIKNKETKKDEIFIKILRNNNDYQWIKIQIKDRSSSKFLNELKEYKIKNPTITKKGKKYFLYFMYEKNVKYKEAKEVFKIKKTKKGKKFVINNLRILGIDLGINNDAICSIIDNKGTVLGKKFINFSREKGQINQFIKRRNKQYSKTNTKKYNQFPKINRKITNHQKDLGNKIVNELFLYIKSSKIDYVILENLDNFLKVKNRNQKEKFHYWRKISIQNKLISKLESIGIRYRKINPKGTSQYAFNGSGKVNRGLKINKEIKKNYSLCKFTDNKIYNSDLNASYNIGSRFIYNELIKYEFKDNKENRKELQQFKTKVLELFCRTSFCLSDIRKIQKTFSEFSFI